MTQKIALVTGISGMDGSHLAELLLEKDYEVHGIVRYHAVDSNIHPNIEHIKDKITLHNGDLCDESGIFNIIQKVQPNELYHLGAISHVHESSANPLITTKVNALGTISILEAIRQIIPSCRFYNAATSEMMGLNIDDDGFQRESTKMEAVSIYGASKLFAYNACKHYRQAYPDMHISNGILFNHTSSRRGDTFVEKKIVNYALDIVNGNKINLPLGNLYPQRDIGSSKDYVRGMWLMLQQPTGDDYVLSTGQTHSIEEICSIVFSRLGLDYKQYVVEDPRYIRKQELVYLKGDSSKAREVLGWVPTFSLDDMIDDMIVNNIRYNETNLTLKRFT